MAFDEGTNTGKWSTSKNGAKFVTRRKEIEAEEKYYFMKFLVLKLSSAQQLAQN